MAIIKSTALELNFQEWLRTQVEFVQNTKGVTLDKVTCIYELDEDGEPTFGIEVVPLVIPSNSEGKL